MPTFVHSCCPQTGNVTNDATSFDSVTLPLRADSTYKVLHLVCMLPEILDVLQEVVHSFVHLLTKLIFDGWQLRVDITFLLRTAHLHMPLASLCTLAGLLHT